MVDQVTTVPTTNYGRIVEFQFEYITFEGLSCADRAILKRSLDTQVPHG
jgi:hypothetical protein